MAGLLRSGGKGQPLALGGGGAALSLPALTLLAQNELCCAAGIAAVLCIVVPGVRIQQRGPPWLRKEVPVEPKQVIAIVVMALPHHIPCDAAVRAPQLGAWQQAAHHSRQCCILLRQRCRGHFGCPISGAVKDIHLIPPAGVREVCVCVCVCVCVWVVCVLA